MQDISIIGIIVAVVVLVILLFRDYEEKSVNNNLL